MNNKILDESGKYIRSITYREFVDSLDPGRKKLIGEYENSIIDFFSIMEKNGFLKKQFSKFEIDRMMKLGDTNQSIHSLIDNSWKIAGRLNDKAFAETLYMTAKKLGFNIIDLDRQIMANICMSYAFHIEHIKKEFILLIDFKKIKVKKNPGKLSLGILIKFLKENPQLKNDLTKNDFFNFLDTKTRNAISHFSFYFEGPNIQFCSEGPFDPNPYSMDYFDIMKESLIVNTLSIAFYLIYKDKFLNKK